MSSGSGKHHAQKRTTWDLDRELKKFQISNMIRREHGSRKKTE
jgi:hypothetical protein